MADGSQLALGELPEREASLAAARPARANAAFWFGVASLVTWLVPTLGLPVSAVGLMLAIRGRRVHAERARVATVLCTIGVALSLTMWVGSAVVVDKLG